MIKIPYSRPTLGKEEEEATVRVLRSGWLACGKETAAFEQEFADYITPRFKELPGTSTELNFETVKPYYAIFTNSGTAALKLAYKWAKEQGTDNIVVTSNTFSATYAAAVEMGLSYSWDYDPHDPRLFTTPNTKKVTVHYGGIKDETPCLIEDSAHRIEPNDPLIGKIRIYSFYVTKNMTTGQGGMLVTDDPVIYEQCRLWWRDGLTTSTADRIGGVVDYEVKAMAGGYDGNDLAAAIGRVQLKKLPEFTRRRNDIRDRYNKALGQTWLGNHLYPFFVDNKEHVSSLRQYLYDRGIGTSYNYPGTGWLGVSLPIYPLLTDEQVDTIIEAIHQWQKTLTPSTSKSE